MIYLKCILGNGWSIMGAAEALTTLSELGLNNTIEFKELLQNFQNHAGNLSLLQSKNDGRWHNILGTIHIFRCGPDVILFKNYRIIKLKLSRGHFKCAGGNY